MSRLRHFGRCHLALLLVFTTLSWNSAYGSGTAVLPAGFALLDGGHAWTLTDSQYGADRTRLPLLRGIDRARDILLDNTMRFARGLPANNAMLWGARGMGKSSLVKAAHAAANKAAPGSLALIEIHREDIATLPDLLRLLRGESRRCLIFCDDLSFERRVRIQACQSSRSFMNVPQLERSAGISVVLSHLPFT